NKMHNIKLRQIAIKKGFKLSEYGLFYKKTGKQVAGSDEKQIYKKLGLDYIPPELREDTGEIQAAQSHKLPKLVELKDIKGDLHCHSKWSDGDNTIEEMAVAAKKLGLKYIAVTDHSPKLKIGHGLSESDVIKKLTEIKKVNKKLKNFRVLSGTEVDILKDGSLDYSDSLLKKIDIVVASVHSSFKMPRNKMTERIIKAMENKYVHIIGHPTGRILKERNGYDIDFEKIIEAAKDTNTALEINCTPTRMDLDPAYIRKAVENKVKLSIGTDAHNASEIRFISLGVAMARKGWCRKGDILNSLDAEKLLKAIKK
ncbi:DNA polymerase III, partial [Candidatus Heimdallarchaeota archaeon]